MSVRSSILAAAALAACTAVATPALAQPAPSIAVSYADLDLTDNSSRVTLDRRIANAAEQLCGWYQPTDLTLGHAVRVCQSATIALAQPQRDAAVGVRGEVQVSSADRFIRVNRAVN